MVFVQKFEESEAEVKWKLIVKLTRSLAVAMRPRDAPGCCLIKSMMMMMMKILLSLEVTQVHSNSHR